MHDSNFDAFFLMHKTLFLIYFNSKIEKFQIKKKNFEHRNDGEISASKIMAEKFFVQWVIKNEDMVEKNGEIVSSGIVSVTVIPLYSSKYSFTFIYRRFDDFSPYLFILPHIFLYIFPMFKDFPL